MIGGRVTTVSEELENSLQQSIESCVNERLRGIDEQLGRLQHEFNEALARLRESTASGQMDAPVSSAITSHLQAAREQKLTGTPSTPAPPADFSLVRNAVEEIRNQQTQTDVLGALLRNAAQFADRVALFVVKGDQAIGWRICDMRDRNQLNSIPGISLPLSGNSLVSQAAQSAATQSASGSSAEGSDLIAKLGGEPQQLAAVPLVVRKRVVAVLYADSSWPHQDAIQSDGLEALAVAAGMAVELIAPTRAAQPQPSATVAERAPAPPEPEVTPAREEIHEAVTAELPPAEPEYAPQVEAEAEPAAQVEEPPAQVEQHDAPFAAEAAEVETAPPAEPAPPPPVEAPVEAPAFSQQYSAPLGAARRWGVTEDLPVEVGEDERRLHNDARRFARLLVSEIKLYNEQKVSEGRSQGNIYDRLREDIDRSRQMYDKRVAPPVAARHDYFHQELVNTLAEGDPSKLGNGYPGAMVGVS